MKPRRTRASPVSGNCEALFVNEERGRGLASKDPIGNPLPQTRSGACVIGARQNQVHEVVRTCARDTLRQAPAEWCRRAAWRDSREDRLWRCSATAGRDGCLPWARKLQHSRPAEGLRAVRAKPIFVGGVASHAGKSWMTTAICAWLRQRGLSGRAVQGAEHVEQLLRVPRRRRDRPRAGGAGGGVRPRTGDRHESDSAQAEVGLRAARSCSTAGSGGLCRRANTTSISTSCWSACWRRTSGWRRASNTS